jgi:hypothetical protein
MLLDMAGQWAYSSLEKIMGRKNRYLEFTDFTFKKADLPLADLQLNFLDKLVTYNMVHHSVDQNTAMKYAQHFKEIIKRCLSNGWMAANIFVNFKCPYIEPHRDWLTMEQFTDFMHTDFGEKSLQGSSRLRARLTRRDHKPLPIFKRIDFL